MVGGPINGIYAMDHHLGTPSQQFSLGRCQGSLSVDKGLVMVGGSWDFQVACERLLANENRQKVTYLHKS